MGTSVGAGKEAPSAGEVMDTVGALLPACTLTTTVNTLTTQKYGNEPTVVKVLAKTWPVLKTPESHRLSSLVVLWKSDTHVHTTWSLTLMVTLSGSNWVGSMSTLAFAANETLRARRVSNPKQSIFPSRGLIFIEFIFILRIRLI